MEQTALIFLALIISINGITSPGFSNEIYVNIHETGQARIMNGEDAQLGQYPYQALIQNSTGGLCGGSIIHKRWILTAAHCADLFRDGEVRHGHVVVGTTRRSTGGITFAVESFRRHEDYYSAPAGNDVGLLRLASDMHFNEYIKPVKLPTDNLNKYVNSWANVTGWGYLSYNGGIVPDVLQHTLVRVIDQKSCDSLWGNMGLITDNEICTSAENRKTPFRGDSGGPLVTYDTQIGIVSYADKDFVERPAVYADVSHYLPWIKSQLSLFYDQLS